MNNERKRFIRRGGRIIPISVKREARAVNEITSGSKNRSSLAKVAGGVLVGLGGLYGAGRMHKAAMAMNQFSTKSRVLNRIAKFTKFGSHSAGGIIAGKELASIDARSRDEKAHIFNLGNTTKSAAATGASLVAGYGTYRLGKRIEYAGKTGLNLFKASNWKKIKNLSNI